MRSCVQGCQSLANCGPARCDGAAFSQPKHQPHQAVAPACPRSCQLADRKQQTACESGRGPHSHNQAPAPSGSGTSPPQELPADRQQSANGLRIRAGPAFLQLKPVPSGTHQPAPGAASLPAEIGKTACEDRRGRILATQHQTPVRSGTAQPQVSRNQSIMPTGRGSPAAVWQLLR